MAAGDMSISNILENNRKWAKTVQEQRPEIFKNLATTQHPKYLWIGCADSRVDTLAACGLSPGDVFVQRNVGNLASHKDLNCMVCMEYAVNHLGVQHIIVCGHYNCGACKASLAWTCEVTDLANLWIADIKDVRNEHAAALKGLPFEQQWAKLCELNTIRQVVNVCTSPIVANAWKKGAPLAVHGVIYSPATGHIKELTVPITGVDVLKKHYEDGNMQELVDSMAKCLSFPAA